MSFWLPRELWLGYAVLIGACVGSFLNVVIARLPAGLSVVRPRSRCPRCLASIAWYDNVPIVSYLVLRGRCRGCHTRISPRYMVVELLAAALALALYIQLGSSWQLVLWAPLAAALLVLTFLDIDHYWLPDVITLPAMAWAALGSLLPGGVTPARAALGLLPAVGLWAFAAAFERLTRREGMGLGDVKLLAVLGLALGPVGALLALFLAALQGSAVGLLLLLAGWRGSNATHADGWTPPPRALPFGPFLVLACYEIVLLPTLLNATMERWLALGGISP